MTECERRCYIGSVKESYGKNSGKYHDLIKDEIIKTEDYVQYITALQAIIGDKDEQLSTIIGANAAKTLHIGTDVVIKKNELFNSQDILFLQALVTILKSDPETVKNQQGTHCAASCTGLCFHKCDSGCSGCSGGCNSHCSNHTSGGGGSSSCGDCTGGCGGKCTGFCTGNCHSTCKSSSGSCGKCGGNCDSSCSQGCSGTMK